MAKWSAKFERFIADRILNLCVLRPSRDEIDVEGLQRVEISHADSKIRTEAYVFSTLPADLQSGNDQQPCRHLVIKFPGTGGRAERASEAPLNLLYPNLANQTHSAGEQVEVWTWNPPGYGRSDRPSSLRTQGDYAIEFAKFVLERSAGPETVVWLAGNSLGCLMALRLAANLDDWVPKSLPRDQLGCWLRNPPNLAPVIRRVARRYRSEWFMNRVLNHLPTTLDPVANAAKASIPVVFLASEKDSLVPLEIQATTHEAYSGEKRIVILEGLEHDGLIEEQHIPAIRDAVQWLIGKRSADNIPVC